MVTFNRIKKLLTYDVSTFDDVERLQKFKVELIDAINYIERHRQLCLTKQSVERGFIIPLASESASGFVPRDFHMSTNAKWQLKRIEERLQYLYSSYK